MRRPSSSIEESRRTVRTNRAPPRRAGGRAPGDDVRPRPRWAVESPVPVLRGLSTDLMGKHRRLRGRGVWGARLSHRRRRTGGLAGPVDARRGAGATRIGSPTNFDYLDDRSLAPDGRSGRPLSKRRGRIDRRFGECFRGSGHDGPGRGLATRSGDQPAMRFAFASNQRGGWSVYSRFGGAGWSAGRAFWSRTSTLRSGPGSWSPDGVVLLYFCSSTTTR